MLSGISKYQGETNLRAMVTGSNGFLGTWLMKALRNERDINYIAGVSRHGNVSMECGKRTYINNFAPWMVVNDKCELMDSMQVKSLLNYHKPDIIFHLAGNPLIKEDSAESYQSNVVPLLNIIEHCRPGAKLVFASSAAVYGNSTGFSIEAQALTPNSRYGAAKAACEHLLQANASKNPYTICRLVANCGFGASHGVVKDIIAKLKGPSASLELIGDFPGSTKHYCYVEDTINAIVKFGMNPYCREHIINVAPDGVANIDLMAHIIMEELGIKKTMVWLGESANWAGDNRRVFVNNAFAKSLGWKPRFTSEQAIRQAAKEMRF